MSSSEQERQANQIGMLINEHTDDFLAPQNEEQRAAFTDAFFQMLEENQHLIREEGHCYCPHPDCEQWGPPHTH